MRRRRTGTKRKNGFLFFEGAFSAPSFASALAECESSITFELDCADLGRWRAVQPPPSFWYLPPPPLILENNELSATSALKYSEQTTYA